MIKIAPSILSADFSRLADEIAEVEKAGADLIHVDVMDGCFVPNISIGQPVVRSIRKTTKLPLDVHLMIEKPDRYLKEFIDAGSDRITFHIEADTDVNWCINTLREFGVSVGIALRPETPISAIRQILDGIDIVLVMGVEPGFGGQRFMESVLPKISELRKFFKGEIEVDGGVNRETICQVINAGADTLVAGNAVFGSGDSGKAVKELKKLATKC
ncbi:MAG: ribulose-phosphate 3-epimerase [Candidatus Diapherotrites archaeon]|nr:ribulose-phosphate 3-epimerase [Candidatus Diapherotrites archaeon]